LHSIEDCCVGFLEVSHYFLSISNFSVESFHFVVVNLAVESYVAYVFCSCSDPLCGFSTFLTVQVVRTRRDV
jgi:hypothetical protein